MCMMIYIAADRPLPPVEWREDNPAFHIKGLIEENDIIRRHFSKSFVYRVGAHTGCSCGFNYNHYTTKSEAETVEERESVRRLSAYLKQATQIAGPIELYACWDGEQDEEPESRNILHTRDMGGDRFWFEELQFLTVQD